METLKIKKENAVKAHSDANSKGKKLLENLLGKNIFQLNIRERIQTMDDVFELNGTTQKEFDKKWKGFADHEIGNALEVLIVAAYNEGKLPDWEDGTPKYYARFRMSSSSGVGFACNDFVDWYALSAVGSRLCFVGPEAYDNLLDAVKKFLPQYQQSRTS